MPKELDVSVPEERLNFDHLIESYKCSVCGLEGVKLWREYNPCTRPIELFCVHCTCWLADKSEELVDAKGYYLDTLLPPEHSRVDSLGWFIPAIPLRDLRGYQSYSTVDEEGTQWWEGQPTRLEGEQADESWVRRTLWRISSLDERKEHKKAHYLEDLLLRQIVRWIVEKHPRGQAMCLQTVQHFGENTNPRWFS